MSPERLTREQRLSEGKKELKHALTVWKEFFPEFDPDIITDEYADGIILRSLYLVGDKLEDDSGNYLYGTRLGYSRLYGGFTLYANDYGGNPAPLLMQLAKDLIAKGVKIVHVAYQGSYEPPNAEEVWKTIKEFNATLKSST